MKQRIFSLVIVLVVFVTSFAVVPVPVQAADFGESLETLENATMSAVYETIRKLGYKFVEIPFGDDSAFTEVMKPIVDQMVNNGLDPTSLFRRLGNQLYYNIGEVVQWVKSLFGSDNSGQFSPLSNGDTIDKNLYNAKLAARAPLLASYGQLYGYPLMLLDDVILYRSYSYYGSSEYIGKANNMYVIPCYYDNSKWVFFNRIVCGFQYTVKGSSYTFYLNSNNSSPFWLDDVQQGTYYRGLVLNSDYYAAVNYNNFLNYTVASAFNLDDAIRQYREYLDSHLINISYDIWSINNPSNHFHNTGIIYKIERPSAPSSEPTGYVPVNYDYVINNFGDATYIYEGDTIINGVTGSAIQVELVSPSAVHVIVDNMDDMSNETNNQIINNYDFDFGDLNIGGAIDDSAGHISDGIKDVATGSALGFLNGFAETVPADIRIMVFSFVAIALIAGVIGRVSGG